MQNVLITGGAGFIGSHFIRYLLQKNLDVNIINLDLLTYAGQMENIDDLQKAGRHLFVHGDICDSGLVQRILVENQIDTIINFAAETHVDRSIVAPESFVRTNISGVFNLLENARRVWAGSYAGNRFHQISTDEVYGTLEDNDPESTERSPYQPRSPYAASKAAADHLVRAYFHTYGFPITISICSNNYGPNQFPEKLIPLTILNALQKKNIPLYGDGHHVRDWIFVLDHCEAIYQIITRGTLGETYNIGAQSPLQNIFLLQKICGYLDELYPANHPYSSLITHVPDRPGHDRRYAINTSKVKSEFGWTPHYDMEIGLQMTIKWFLEKKMRMSGFPEDQGHHQ